MAQTKQVEKPDITISTSACKHHFGFLSQRAKGVATPEECFTCEKMLDCMAAKPDDTSLTVEFEEMRQDKEVVEEAVEEAVEKVEEPTSKPTEALEPEPEPVVVIEEIKEPVVEHKPKTIIDNLPKMSNIIKEQVTKRIGQAKVLTQRILKPLEQFKPAKSPGKPPVERSENDNFCVGSPSTLYNHRSGTVLVNKQRLDSWGMKVKEVELQTENGRVTICRAHGISDLPPQVVQVPSKIKSILNIEDGSHIRVKPIKE